MILKLTQGARRPVVAVLAAALAVPACSSASGGSDGRLSVVASFYPVAEAASRVGGSLVSVNNLTTPGVEPHDLELTPRQLGEIADADVVLYLGGGFQPAIEDAVGDASGDVVDVARGVDRLPVGAADAGEGLTSDPHVWLDPVAYRRIVGTVAAALSRAQRADAARFERNADAFGSELAALDDAFGAGLASCERDVVVTSHAAFGYLTARYGLRQEAISGLSPDAEPTPQRLDHLRAIVEREGVTTIFTEELVSPRVAETLARETGATTEVLDPLESLTPDEVAAGQDYLSVMRSNLSKLEAALGCS
jgi:zinc transport system substrate-binding protein